MALLTRFRGDVKDGKTLSMVYYALTRFYRQGIPVFSNMKECVFAQQFKIDDLLVDLTKPQGQAKFRCGVAMFDEAHIYYSPESGGIQKALLTHFMVQAGKQGLIILYTTHLAGMMSSRIQEITTVSVTTQTPDEGRTVFWDVKNEKMARRAYYNGQEPPQKLFQVLHNASRIWPLYECNEPINPFSLMESFSASDRGRQIMKGVKRYQQDGAGALDTNDQGIKQTVMGVMRELEAEKLSRQELPRSREDGRARAGMGD